MTQLFPTKEPLTHLIYTSSHLALQLSKYNLSLLLPVDQHLALKYAESVLRLVLCSWIERSLRRMGEVYQFAGMTCWQNPVEFTIPFNNPVRSGYQPHCRPVQGRSSPSSLSSSHGRSVRLRRDGILAKSCRVHNPLSKILLKQDINRIVISGSWSSRPDQFRGFVPIPFHYEWVIAVVDYQKLLCHAYWNEFFQIIFPPKYTESRSYDSVTMRKKE